MEYVTTERVSALIDGLTDQDLEYIYWRGARLCLDTGDCELRLVFGEQDMRFEAASGHWLSTKIGAYTDDDHPVDEYGDLLTEWPPLVPLMHWLLKESAGDIAVDLQIAAEQHAERAQFDDEY